MSFHAGSSDAARAAADIVFVTPGLSVIAEAVKESRRISQRMLSFTVYRIAATLHMLIFFTLSYIIFEFWLPASLILIIM